MSLGLKLAWVVFSLLLVDTAQAERAHVAVASNFAAAAKQIVSEFEATSSHNISLSLGSSGKLYAQIVNGAPFDVFLSADQAKPAALAERGFVADRKTYALGKLALWLRHSMQQNWQTELKRAQIKRIALANPRLAPYGAATREVLSRLGLESSTQSKWVIGENIAQTFQFVSSGNADAGFIAYSQMIAHPQSEGTIMPISTDLHSAIAQDAVLLNRASANKAAKAFYQFLQTKRVQTLIQEAGYQLPQNGS